jgi:AcrR family transcriptional regulator
LIGCATGHRDEGVDRARQIVIDETFNEMLLYSASSAQSRSSGSGIERDSSGVRWTTRRRHPARVFSLGDAEAHMPGSKAPEEERRRQILAAAYRVAGEQGLADTTILQVAAVAGVSPGLVIFHFGNRRELLLALLEELLATTTVLRSDASERPSATPEIRLLSVLRQEIERLTREPVRIRLTFDYWMASMRDAETRKRLKAEFARYRDAFRPLAEAVLAAHPERFPGVTADGLSGLSVSLIKGCAVQSMIDPDHFDVDEYFTAAVGLLGASSGANAAA